MLQNIKVQKMILFALISVAAAFVSAKYLQQGNPLVSGPWGLLAFLAAFAAGTQKEAVTLGGTIGFVSSYAYLWFDDTGTLRFGKIVFLIFLIILPALFGLLCGLLCSWLGWIVKRKLAIKRPPD